MAVAGARVRDRAGGSLGFAGPAVRVAHGFSRIAEKRSGEVRPWPPDVTSYTAVPVMIARQP